MDDASSTTFAAMTSTATANTTSNYGGNDDGQHQGEGDHTAAACRTILEKLEEKRDGASLKNEWYITAAGTVTVKDDPKGKKVLLHQWDFDGTGMSPVGLQYSSSGRAGTFLPKLASNCRRSLEFAAEEISQLIANGCWNRLIPLRKGLNEKFSGNMSCMIDALKASKDAEGISKFDHAVRQGKALKEQHERHGMDNSTFDSPDDQPQPTVDSHWKERPPSPSPHAGYSSDHRGRDQSAHLPPGRHLFRDSSSSDAVSSIPDRLTSLLENQHTAQLDRDRDVAAAGRRRDKIEVQRDRDAAAATRRRDEMEAQRQRDAAAAALRRDEMEAERQRDAAAAALRRDEIEAQRNRDAAEAARRRDENESKTVEMFGKVFEEYARSTRKAEHERERERDRRQYGEHYVEDDGEGEDFSDDGDHLFHSPARSTRELRRPETARRGSRSMSSPPSTEKRAAMSSSRSTGKRAAGTNRHRRSLSSTLQNPFAKDDMVRIKEHKKLPSTKEPFIGKTGIVTHATTKQVVVQLFDETGQLTDTIVDRLPFEAVEPLD